MKKYIILSLFFFGVFSLSVAQAQTSEDITITTYYPSPAGSYRTLMVLGNLTLETSPISNDAPQIEWRTNAASNRHWNIDQFGDRLRFFTEDAGNANREELFSITRNGDVGIDETNPSTKLEVNGGIRVGNESGLCNSTLAGTLRRNQSTGELQYCKDNSWSSLSPVSTGLYGFKAEAENVQQPVTCACLSLGWGTVGSVLPPVTHSGNCPAGFQKIVIEAAVQQPGSPLFGCSGFPCISGRRYTMCYKN